MKITIWLRNDKDKTDGATLRLDVKYESYDNMLVRRYGEKLVKAIESGGEKNGMTKKKRLALARAAQKAARGPACWSASDSRVRSGARPIATNISAESARSAPQTSRPRRSKNARPRRAARSASRPTRRITTSGSC